MVGDPAPFLSARRERFIVLLDGRVPSAAVRQGWAEAARSADLGDVVNHVRTGAPAEESVWMAGATSHLTHWLRLLEEGEIRWTPGRLSLSGRVKSPEALATLTESARRALPQSWVLDAGLGSDGVGQRAVLNLRWEEGTMRCEGFLPQKAWQARKVAWSAEPGLQLIISDQVSECSGPEPGWLDGVPMLARAFQGEVRDGVIQIDDSAITLRGKVNDLVSKLRAGREARALVGTSLEVLNYLLVDPTVRLPDVIVAAAAPQPEPVMAVPAPVTNPAPIPVPIPAVPPVVVKKSAAKGTKAGTIMILADSNGLRLDGEIPDDGIKSTIVGSCGLVPGNRKVADQTKVTSSVRAEAWNEAIPACLLAISEHLAQGEFRIAEGKVTLQGVAKTVPGRDRLLAAIARALPNDMRIDDHTTVIEEASGELFSRNVYFNTGSTYIKPEHREHLREIVAAIKSGRGEMTLLIKGYADPRGDSQINEKLSRDRAKAVFDSLVKQGVDARSLEFVGVGAAESSDATGEYVWKQERRVELTLVK